MKIHIANNLTNTNMVNNILAVKRKCKQRKFQTSFSANKPKQGILDFENLSLFEFKAVKI